jgi:hypothetical protein
MDSAVPSKKGKALFGLEAAVTKLEGEAPPGGLVAIGSGLGGDLGTSTISSEETLLSS